MARGRILVDIDREGNIRWEVSGVAGPACRDLVTELEHGLGGDATVQPTAEMTQTAANVARIQA